MKTVLIYQVQTSGGWWNSPQCYVPTDEEDYKRCKSYDESCGMHLIKEIEVDESLDEINLKDYVFMTDNVLDIDKHYYLLGRVNRNDR